MRILNESEAPPESFHDCHVHGIRWNRDQFSFALDLQYILEWIRPEGTAGAGYQFRIAEARVTFQNASEVKLSMDWSGSALDCQIAELRLSKTRATPKGQLERLFEIELADPDGRLSLWSTGYEVSLLGEPVVSTVPAIPPPGKA